MFYILYGRTEPYLSPLNDTSPTCVAPCSCWKLRLRNPSPILRAGTPGGRCGRRCWLTGTNSGPSRLPQLPWLPVSRYISLFAVFLPLYIYYTKLSNYTLTACALLLLPHQPQDPLPDTSSEIIAGRSHLDSTSCSKHCFGIIIPSCTGHWSHKPFPYAHSLTHSFIKKTMWLLQTGAATTRPSVVTTVSPSLHSSRHRVGRTPAHRRRTDPCSPTRWRTPRETVRKRNPPAFLLRAGGRLHSHEGRAFCL